MGSAVISTAIGAGCEDPRPKRVIPRHDQATTQRLRPGTGLPFFFEKHCKWQPRRVNIT
jgi:hypothetical protein